MQRTRRTCLTKSGIVSEGATARPPAGALTEGLFKIDGTTAIGPIRSGTSFEGSIAAAGMNAPSGGFLGCGGESLMSAAHSTSVRLASSSLMAAWQLPWGKPQNGGDTGYILHFSKNSIPGITEFCGIGLAHGMRASGFAGNREETASPPHFPLASPWKPPVPRRFSWWCAALPFVPQPLRYDRLRPHPHRWPLPCLPRYAKPVLPKTTFVLMTSRPTWPATCSDSPRPRSWRCTMST